MSSLISTHLLCYRRHSAKILRSREPARRLNAIFLNRRSFHQFHEMADEGGKSYARRDKLLEIESKVRVLWEEKYVFKAEPCEKPPQPGEKFFGNFPFPYMNGFLHLDHAFPLSKLEFAAAYHRLRVRVVFGGIPFQVKIVMGLEEEFGITVEEANAQSITAVQDAADLMEKLSSEKGA